MILLDTAAARMRRAVKMMMNDIQLRRWIDDLMRMGLTKEEAEASLEMGDDE